MADGGRPRKRQRGRLHLGARDQGRGHAGPRGGGPRREVAPVGSGRARALGRPPPGLHRHPPHRRRRRRQEDDSEAMRRARGFTLVELLIALAIVGLLLTIAFGGLRVAMAAWTPGEDRAEAHQHLRAIAFTLARALGAAYPYRGAKGDAPEALKLFNGAEQKLQVVTHAPPRPAQVPVALTA